MTVYFSGMVHEIDDMNIVSGCYHKHPVCQSHLITRDVSASGILDGKHEEVPVSNCIDNTSAAVANPIELVQTFEFCDAGWARTGTECMEALHENFLKRFGECVKLLLSRRGQKNCGDGLVQSETQLFQNDIK